jgi:hypothetical protein
MRQTVPSNVRSRLRLVLIVSILMTGVLKVPGSRKWVVADQAYAQSISGTGLPSVTLSSSVEAPRLGQTALTATDPTSPTDSGGGEYRPSDVPDLTEQQRQAIQSEIDTNIQRLGLASLSAAFTTSLTWPVQGAAGQTDYGYHGISAFVDHNAAYPDQLRDWNCGDRTYDLASGYNHRGTDFFTWPFGWYKMDNNIVEAVAAAPGTIIDKHDGEFDRSCGMNTNPWNAVYILHADGSVAWYGHLKKNSVTSKAIGAPVVAGEYLGVVGSSGSSTGPHLHFELHESNAGGSPTVDPFAGACNNIPSWWAAQRPYYDSAINKLATGNAAPVFPACPNPEIPNTTDVFNPGDTVYFTTYYRDQLLGQQSLYKVYQPDGAVYRSWTGTSSASHYSASYWYRSYTLGASVPLGLWKFEVVYNGQTYQHTFSVGNTVYLTGRPADHALYLGWKVVGTLPVTSTWQIAYTGPTGDQSSPVTGIISSTRAYSLTGLTNYAWYTVTLAEIDNTLSTLTSTVSVMPTDILVYLPHIAK